MPADAPTPAPASSARGQVAVAHAGLPFTSPWLLAPMEGVTEPCFRELVLARNPPHALGGAFTEFVRVHEAPVPRHVLRKHMGPRRFDAPVGVQLMGADTAKLAASAARAVECGAPLVDLNFGCPAKGAISGCAGSALLREPARVEELVCALVKVCAPTPVSAKIRAGFDHDRDLEALARAAENGGAALLTVHCRTRVEAYCEQVDWTRIARAVAAVRIPVCGNGSIRSHDDLERMRRETGCAFAMVGRGALADPWIFSGAPATREQAAQFLLEYAATTSERNGAPAASLAPRLKQLLRYWSCGGLVADEDDRRKWLEERSGEALLARLSAAFTPL